MTMLANKMILGLLMTALPNLVSSLNIEVLTKNMTLKMGETGSITLKLSGRPQRYEDQVVVDIRVPDNSTHVIHTRSNTVYFSKDDIWLSENATKDVILDTNLIGIGQVQFWVDGELRATQEISVIVSNKGLADLFMIIMTAMIIVNTFNMGAQLDLQILKEVFKKPIGPVVGFISQFVFMPGFSLLVGYLFTDDMLFRLGLFVLGCCPGGNGSNFWTLLLEGDINLSIAMTFVSTVAAIGMMPLWIFIVAPFLTDGTLVIPFTQLIVSLIILILPITLGMAIRWKWTKAAEMMGKVIVPFTLTTVIFILTAGVYINLYIFQLMTWTMVLAGFTVCFTGYAFGATFAWIFRLDRRQIIAVAIETSFQNGGIAFVLLQLSFPEPLGELASVAPVAQLMLTGLPLWLVLIPLKLYKCYRRKKYSGVPQNGEASTVKQLEKPTVIIT